MYVKLPFSSEMAWTCGNSVGMACIIIMVKSESHLLVFIMTLYIRFEFVKPCFGRVVMPKTPVGHKWTGDRVKALTPQGQDLYITNIRALCNLNVSIVCVHLLTTISGFLLCSMLTCRRILWITQQQMHVLMT